MEINGPCRCCLAQGLHKDLYSCYVYLDKKETYSEMLQECFNIILSPSKQATGCICNDCIKALRSSCQFRQQVLDTEQEFLKLIKEESKDEKPIQVKMEFKEDSDDSDDYFLADAVSMESSLETIKKEIKDVPIKKKEPKKSRCKSTVKKPDKNAKSGWRTEKIKSLVTRLAQSINSCEIDMKPLRKKEVQKKPRKLTISKEPYESQINLMWNKPNHDKYKHQENLRTILKYSNVTPFKNKSLLGYICGYCDTPYPDPADLRVHTDIDHKKDRLSFKTNFDLTEYIVKIDVTDLCCTLCDNKLDNMTVFKEHLIKVHDKIIYNDIKDHILQFKLKKGDVYDCAMCTATYETFKMLKQHMNKHYSNYICPKCETPFATKRSLNAHRSTHQEGSFKCEHCDKVFSSRAKQHYHEKTKHLGTRNISNCPYCNVPFRSYYQRNQHLVKVHNTEAQYKCNVCDKAYILKSLLMYHIKKCHLMERNCQCTECGYRFFSKKALKAHMVKHTGERKYSCEVCHKSYARKYTLREHMRIHNNDRRFKCDVCGMTFVQKCSLKSHLLSNHGISMAASDITCT